MIDATKLKDGAEYWIYYHGKVWAAGMWHADKERFTVCVNDIPYYVHELTDAIPIPSPETLAEMWRVIQNVAYPDGLTDSPDEFEARIYDRAIHDLARKLLEKKT